LVVGLAGHQMSMHHRLPHGQALSDLFNSGQAV